MPYFKRRQKVVLPSRLGQRPIYVSPIESQKIFDILFEPNGGGLKSQYTYQNRFRIFNFNDIYTAISSVCPASWDKIIETHQQAILNRESILLDRTGSENGITPDHSSDLLSLPTRVFIPKPNGVNYISDLADLMRQGLSFFRAGNAILDHGGVEDNQQLVLLKSLCKIMQSYQLEYQQAELDKKKSHYSLQAIETFQAKLLKKAQTRLAYFNGALANDLVEKGLCANFKKACQALRFIRGCQLSMTTHKERQCTILTAPNVKPTLAFLTPATFDECKESLWKNYLNENWYQKRLKQKILGLENNWLDHFFATHAAQLQKVPSTPMLRFLPMPANAFDATTAIFDEEGKLYTLLNNGRLGITEPFNLGDKTETGGIKEIATVQNHLRLIGQERLTQDLADYFVRWGALEAELTKEEKAVSIEVPFLYLTFATNNVSLAGDTQKSVTFIKNKEQGQKALEKEFKNKTYQIDDYPPVIITPLDINNCPNIHEIRSDTRDCDIDHSQRLLTAAANLLKRYKNAISRIDDEYHLNKEDQTTQSLLGEVIDFLTEKNNPSIVDTAKVLSARLKRWVDPKAVIGRQLDLLIQTAIQLKFAIHESFFTRRERQLKNWLVKIPLIGRLLKWGLNLLLGIPKMMMGLPNWIRNHATRRDALSKSAYEVVLAQLVALLKFGCVSNIDRAGQVAKYAQAIARQYADTGQIIHYDATPETRKDFLGCYCGQGQLADAYNFAKIVTMAPVLETKELNLFGLPAGIPVEYASEKELVISLKQHGTRKGQMKDIQHDGFIKKVDTDIQQMVEKQQQTSTTEVNAGLKKKTVGKVPFKGEYIEIVIPPHEQRRPSYYPRCHQFISSLSGADEHKATEQGSAEQMPMPGCF